MTLGKKGNINNLLSPLSLLLNPTQSGLRRFRDYLQKLAACFQQKFIHEDA